MQYDSSEELYFSWYLEELRENRVITDWHYHPKPFILSDRIVHVYDKILKTKTVSKDSVIINDHQYQADFLIHWNPEWIGKIFLNLNQKCNVKDAIFVAQGKTNFSVIDVKGTFIGPHNTSAITFPLNMKWVYQKYHIYVQKIIPVQLFAETFIPKAYQFTDNTGKPRKIKFKKVLIKEYLESIRSDLLINPKLST
jgi:hypothetical protein